MGLTRRRLLQAGGLGLLASAVPAWVGAAREAAEAPLLVAVFLRGGADALHLAPPRGDRAYARLRGELALEHALPFAPGFGLHPALAPLEPVVGAGRLALVPAAGDPEASRSHFEAQDRMELGAPREVHPRDGWLARALSGAGSDSAFGVLAFSARAPLALRGSGALALEDAGALVLSAADRRALEPLYAAASDPAARAGSRGLAALAELERAIGRGRGRRLRGRRRPGAALGVGVEQLLALEAAGLPLRAVWLESGDWDTHARQGGDEGRMARALDDLARALARLDAALAPRRDYAAVVLSEFGRRVRPNGSGGTDHGHGGAILVAGTRLRGGLHGDWPGLAEAELYQGQDLPVANDYRAVLSEVLRAALGAAPGPEVFPGYRATPLGLFRSA